MRRTRQYQNAYSLPPAKALQLLTELVDSWPDSGDGYSDWHARAKNLLSLAYGPESVQLATLEGISYYPPMWTDSTPESVFENCHSAGRRQALEHVRSLLDIMRACEDSSGNGSHNTPNCVGNGDVFLVHGQNLGKLAEVKHLLGQLNVDCCVLGDVPNAGQTIIEKFESHGGSSSYAIVLLTADDRGGSKRNNQLQDRARQNVIFEFGYFCGKLGRHRTAALYESGVEIPSDLQGFVYIELDSHGAWRYKLADELSGAGYSIDKNNIH